MLRWRAEAFEVLTVTFLGICIQRYIDRIILYRYRVYSDGQSLRTYFGKKSVFLNAYWTF